MNLHGLLRGYLYDFICRYCLYLTGNPPIAPHGLLMDDDDVRVSQETHLQTPTACYGYNVTLLFMTLPSNLSAMS
jgi:hypothetical protein